MENSISENKLEFNFEIWTFQELKNYFFKENKKYDEKKLDGFTYIDQTTFSAIEESYRSNIYSKEKNLFLFEKQTSKEEKINYHKAIIASLNQNLIGVLFCKWEKYDFWNYHLQFIDIHQNFKNKKIATNLIKKLNESEFIKNKILYIGMFSDEGEKYAKPILKRELKANDYALVYEDYCGKIPKKYGIYGGNY